MSSAPHPGDALPLFCCPASNRGALSRPQGGHFRHCAARIAAELRHAAGRNPPMPATPTPRETQCRVSAAQSPFGGGFAVHKAAFAYAAPHASPPIGAESHHATGRNPPITTNPTPRGDALPRFRRPISKRGALFRPQGGRNRLPTPSPRLNRHAHRASVTCARLYLPEQLTELKISASLPFILLLPPSRLDAAVRSSCRFGGERWPWLQRA